MCKSFFLTGRGRGGGKDGVGSEAENCCNGILWVMVSSLRVGGWYCGQKRRDNKYKTKGRSKIKAANNKEIPRISCCDVDCGVIVGLDWRWTVKGNESAGVELDEADVELIEVVGRIIDEKDEWRWGDGRLKTDGRSADNIGDGSRDTVVFCEEGEKQRFGDDGRVEQFKVAGLGVASFSKRWKHYDLTPWHNWRHGCNCLCGGKQNGTNREQTKILEKAEHWDVKSDPRCVTIWRECFCSSASKVVCL